MKQRAITMSESKSYDELGQEQNCRMNPDYVKLYKYQRQFYYCVKTLKSLGLRLEFENEYYYEVLERESGKCVIVFHDFKTLFGYCLGIKEKEKTKSE